MASSRSPFKDNKVLEREIRAFLKRHQATFAQNAKRTSAFFELATYNSVVKFYEARGYAVVAKDLKGRDRKEFVYAMSPLALPSRCSYFLATMPYKTRPAREFEIRHNLRVQSAHDVSVFVSPDYAVVERGAVVEVSAPHNFGGLGAYCYAEARNLRTFAEAKHYQPSAEMLLNFVGLVNELMPVLMTGSIPGGYPVHCGPSIFISGVGSRHVERIKASLAQRYGINVFLGVFSRPNQLCSKSNYPNVKTVGSP